jgi:hypothetical protein
LVFPVIVVVVPFRFVFPVTVRFPVTVEFADTVRFPVIVASLYVNFKISLDNPPLLYASK